MAGGEERDQRPAAIAVQQQDDERGDEEHPRDRELVGGRQIHRAGALARSSSFLTAAIASAPVAGRANWKLPSSAGVMTPASTTSDTAG